MNKNILLLLSALVLIAPVRAQDAAGAVTPYGNVVQNYTLAWSDEFNGTALDMNNWDYRTDSKMWSTQQAQNVSVSDGHLVLALKAEHAEHKAFTGGGVISKRRFEFGYFEARFKVPPGSGWHTSFWTAPYGDPKSKPIAENDICEQDSVNLTSYSAGIIAWAEHARGIGRQHVSTPNLAEDFHVWGCEFTPDKVRYFFDGKLTHEADISHIKIGPANIWLTSIASGLGGTHYVNGKRLPATAEFDYVRYFQANTPGH